MALINATMISSMINNITEEDFFFLANDWEIKDAISRSSLQTQYPCLKLS